MRRWRVGTLSMGIVLICSGVGFLYARFSNKAVVEIVLKWWPLIFVLLGLEVLALSYLGRDQDSPLKLKYDIFSILIIMMLVCSGLGLQALDETGVTAKIREKVTFQQFHLRTADSAISLPSGVKKIVLEVPYSSCRLKVFTSKTNTVSAYGNVWVQAASKESAEKMVNNERHIITHVSGMTQFISLDLPDLEHYRMQDCSIFIPQNIDVEILNNGLTQIYADEVENNWKIDGTGDLQVSLPKQANLDIVALIAQGNAFGGNVPWQITELKGANNENNQVNARKSGQVTLGTGTQKMNIIINGGNITVDQI